MKTAVFAANPANGVMIDRIAGPIKPNRTPQLTPNDRYGRQFVAGDVPERFLSAALLCY